MADSELTSSSEVYSLRQPWHDERRWSFTAELEARWTEIRDEFDALRELVRAEEAAAGAGKQETWAAPIKTREDQRREKRAEKKAAAAAAAAAATGGGSSAGVASGSAPGDSSSKAPSSRSLKKGLAKAEAATAGTTAASDSDSDSDSSSLSYDDDVDRGLIRPAEAGVVPLIHPWPETNLYETRPPMWGVDDDDDDDADVDVDAKQGAGEGGKQPQQQNKKPKARRLRPTAAQRAAAKKKAAAAGDDDDSDGSDDDDEDVAPGTGWNVFGLRAFGKRHPRNAKLCPVTADIISRIPGCSTAAFSILAPGARILPHSGYDGYAEMILRCHLGIHIPADESKLWLQVADIRHGWENGKTFVFDDRYEHSATNTTDKERVVLLLDFRAGQQQPVAPPAPADGDGGGVDADRRLRPGAKGQMEYLEDLVTSYGYVDIDDDGGVDDGGADGGGAGGK